MTDQPKQIETWQSRFEEYCATHNLSMMRGHFDFIASERIKLLEEVRALVEEKSYWLNDGVDDTETVVSSDDLLEALKNLEENL